MFKINIINIINNTIRIGYIFIVLSLSCINKYYNIYNIINLNYKSGENNIIFISKPRLCKTEFYKNSQYSIKFNKLKSQIHISPGTYVTFFISGILDDSLNKDIDDYNEFNLVFQLKAESIINNTEKQIDRGYVQYFISWHSDLPNIIDSNMVIQIDRLSFENNYIVGIIHFSGHYAYCPGLADDLKYINYNGKIRFKAVEKNYSTDYMQ